MVVLKAAKFAAGCHFVKTTEMASMVTEIPKLATPAVSVSSVHSELSPDPNDFQLSTYLLNLDVGGDREWVVRERVKSINYMSPTLCVRCASDVLKVPETCAWPSLA